MTNTSASLPATNDTSTASNPRLASTNDWNLDNTERLPAERINELLRSFQRENDFEARNVVVQSNMRLVAYIAARFRNRGLTRDELMSEGAAALIRATSSFDTHRGVSFATYAAKAIEHSMRHALGTANQILSIPAGTRREQAKQRREVQAFFSVEGRQPGAGECSVGVGAAPVVMGLQQGSGQTERGTALDPAAIHKNEVESQDLREHIRGALEKLGGKRAAVLSLRFGLDTGSPRPWDDVARMVGMTVRDTKAAADEALRALRTQLAATDLDQECERPTRSVAAA